MGQVVIPELISYLTEQINLEKNLVNDLSDYYIKQETLEKDVVTSSNNSSSKSSNENETLNSSVIIDQAHRLAPREKSEKEDLEKVKNLLIDSVRTTRKFGLGWMFISQTLSSLNREILNQIRIYVFGFGLGWGIERQALLEIIGKQKEAMTLYQRFRDPQSSLKKKEYPFMTVGPISPLSFSGSPLFFNALKYRKECHKLILRII